MLTKEELLRFANIFDNAGQVFLGLMVISPLISLIDRSIKVGIVLVVVGIIMTLACWFTSWWLTRKATKL